MHAGCAAATTRQHDAKPPVQRQGQQQPGCRTGRTRTRNLVMVMVVLYAGHGCIVCESGVLIIWAHSVDYNKLRRVSVIII